MSGQQSESTQSTPSPVDANTYEKIESFKDLPKSVDLPDLGKSGSQYNLSEKTTSLGTVLLPPNAILQLGLIGGIKAVKGTDSIIMQNSPGAGQQLWQIYVEISARKPKVSRPKRPKSPN